MESQWIRIGGVGKAHGLQGEVRVYLDRRFAAAFPDLRRILLVDEKGREKETDFEVRPSFADSGLISTALAGDRDGAEALRNAVIFADREDLAAVGVEGPFHEDLIGLRVVTREGRDLGVLEDVLPYPAGDLYRVVGEGGETLLPDSPGLIVGIDGGVMTVDPLPGLLGLNG
ncbi:MAG: 16S rRNA processing protein RimM [Candidatus Eisenbacteria bacterium]|nr:16S rRNA processing protein RimM [Candidatus Eisenbacteria bacterium]